MIVHSSGDTHNKEPIEEMPVVVVVLSVAIAVEVAEEIRHHAQDDDGTDEVESMSRNDQRAVDLVRAHPIGCSIVGFGNSRMGHGIHFMLLLEKSVLMVWWRYGCRRKWDGVCGCSPRAELTSGKYESRRVQPSYCTNEVATSRALAVALTLHLHVENIGLNELAVSLVFFASGIKP